MGRHRGPAERAGRRFAVSGAAALLSAAITSACATTQPAAPAEDVRVAVLRFIMESLRQPGDQVPCVRIREGAQAQDPDPEVLGALRRYHADTAPGSECALESFRGRMRHTPTGRPAISYFVSRPTQLDDRSYSLIAGYSAASLDGASCDYIARWTTRGWEVNLDRSRPCAVS